MRRAADQTLLPPWSRTRALPPARALRLLMPALSVLVLAACGGGGGDRAPMPGTVALVNQTDQGMAPLVVDEFYLAPVGIPDPGPNLLTQSVQPGGVVIVGLFPAGMYNAVAVLEGGGQVNFPVAEVVAGQPTNFVLP